QGASVVDGLPTICRHVRPPLLFSEVLQEPDAAIREKYSRPAELGVEPGQDGAVGVIEVFRLRPRDRLRNSHDDDGVGWTIRYVSEGQAELEGSRRHSAPASYCAVVLIECRALSDHSQVLGRARQLGWLIGAAIGKWYLREEFLVVWAVPRLVKLELLVEWA